MAVRLGLRSSAPATQPLLGTSDDATAMPAAERPAALQVIADEVAGCTRCAELVANRSRTVFGVGNPSRPAVLRGRGAGGG